MQQLVFVIYCLVINNKNVSISSSNRPLNFKQLPVLKMPHLNTVKLLQSLSVLERVDLSETITIIKVF